MKRTTLAGLSFITILLLHSCQQPKEPVAISTYGYLEEITLLQLQQGYK